MTYDITDIKEVRNCGRRYTNMYLENGYVLLSALPYADERPMKDGERTFVRKGVTFTVGRPSGVARFDPEAAEAAEEA